jgi:DNA polymerase-1
MEKLVVIDGNSIMNRAFYGIMGNKMLQTEDGIYTNAIYGFLAIMFKIVDDIKPEYIAVAFDLKAPTKRHLMYADYKGTRHGMPDELAVQMPIIKEVLTAMNITIIEKEGYEADDILGTLAINAEKKGISTTILSGDRDTFQLASKMITIRIPRTKAGKTEEEDFTEAKVMETYGVTPLQMIEVKGLMGDKSDNIPGVPGIGEKTALNLIKKYETIENLYNAISEGTATEKGKLRENLENNQELALLSKKLGTIDTNVPIDTSISELRVKEWNKSKVYEEFKTLRFKKYIERFNLNEVEEIKLEKKKIDDIFKTRIINTNLELEKLKEKIIDSNILVYCFETSEYKNSIIKLKINNIYIYHKDTSYQINRELLNELKDIFESNNIKKIGYKQKIDYILLKEQGIQLNNLFFDVEISAYLLDSSLGKYTLNYIAEKYSKIDMSDIVNNNHQNIQLNLFEQIGTQKNNENKEYLLNAYIIYSAFNITKVELEKNNLIDLFNNIEMPMEKILAEMQFKGMLIDKNELIEYGNSLKIMIDNLTKEIHELAGSIFNINSPRQLGKVLFEDLKLTAHKKTKSGYSTDVDTLEKIKLEHPIIEKILEYRQTAKLYSTYVEGMIPYINEKTGRIHSYFHQTVTATGRLSSTEPNLQNIPTRFEAGKKLREVFKPQEGYIYVDADYSQIELRILAHISEDENLINAFINKEDIHKQVASQVFNTPINEVTKEQRSHAKAVNFGIVYGMSDYGLSEEIGVPVKVAKQYIQNYFEKYPKIRKLEDNIIEKAKSEGYVETIYGRKRYIPEINSSSYMVRQSGIRIATNTPIQGTAADIMKIAMINVANKLEQNKLKAKIVLQIHDELLIESPIEEKEQVMKILKSEMENVAKLKVPLVAETSEATNWNECK